MKRFAIAVVGCGNVSRMHFEAYAAHPERIRMVAAFDPLVERAEAACATFGVERAFGSLDEILAQRDFEVAVVCTPTSVRRATVEALAAAGKHVFVEKPMADSLAEAEQIVAACERAGVMLAVNQNYRYHYPFDTARDVIRAGTIGRVVSILQQDLMLRQDSGWRTQMPRHALSVMGIHWFDGFRWILEAEPVSLLAEIASSEAIDCAGETDAAVQMLFDQGTMVSYVQSFASFIKRTETIINGELGTLVLDYSGAVLYDRDHRTAPVRTWENSNRGANKPRATFIDIEQLFTALEQGGEPDNNGRDNLRTVALLEAAYRSAAEHRRIALPEGVPA